MYAQNWRHYILPAVKLKRLGMIKITLEMSCKQKTRFPACVKRRIS